ncbi:hypothetical protein PsorP6_005015 [Peronosclerospora sorghi]|uniref:Uncharacterized protein n=1 Tax=Peronosclerospora sorghi TaxID=230839 RepID=A0ACC0W499_9STRA|nr:hypothetical protein PsorP6_005015 [Peronosclerospora sorghi]
MRLRSCFVDECCIETVTLFGAAFAKRPPVADLWILRSCVYSAMTSISFCFTSPDIMRPAPYSTPMRSSSTSSSSINDRYWYGISASKLAPYFS